jgi:cytochrome bd ubiquinol oxidase subunit II
LSLTIYNSKAGDYGLKVGIVWWTIGIGLASGYFVYLYRSFRGKVALDENGDYGH